MSTTGAESLFSAAQRCLECRDPREKCVLTVQAHAALSAGTLSLRDDGAAPGPARAPGRPDRPRLRPPRDVPRRRLGSDEGRAALVHAVAHIEFNAINLAWDAVWRFRGLPDEYYRDWAGVAADEARHFTMVTARLAGLDHAYGDFDAHDGLWTMAERTRGSCLERMALVPRVLEARGLDVTPGMIARLAAAGDRETCAVLEVILREEIAHVACGSRWFAWCCERAGVEPEAMFRTLVDRHYRGALRGPFNVEARRATGFSAAELERLAVTAA